MSLQIDLSVSEAGCLFQDDSEPAQQKGQSVKQKRRPFPPKHYIATLETLKSSEYPLPIVGPDGKLECPEGYIATKAGVLKDRFVGLVLLMRIDYPRAMRQVCESYNQTDCHVVGRTQGR